MIDPHYADGPVTLYAGDCIDVMRELPDNSVDAVCTDPPYALGFMGREWDSHATARAFQGWCEEWATEALRVLKPGGHLLAFGGMRTQHRLIAGVEDAGFEIRDAITWHYGSGFPKSLDVSKAIDKAAGEEREVIGDKLDRPGYHLHGHDSGTGALGRGISSTTPETRLRAAQVTAPATDAARAWQGWGTALKPATEIITVARKPLTGTVAANVLQYGTGALNIDATRIGYQPDDPTLAWGDKFGGGKLNRNGEEYQTGSGVSGLSGIGQVTGTVNPAGRWPANVILDEHQAAALDGQSGVSQSRIGKPRGAASGDGWGMTATGAEYDDLGGASRFFYTAKAAQDERPSVDGIAHPTVKPLDLMRWLVRLVTPKGGTVLEPFAGSGTTVEACVLEGFDCIAIEREATYLPLIEKRIRKPHHIGFDFGDWEMDA